MIPRRMRYLFWFSILAIIVACVPSFGTPVPTVDPEQVNVFIGQTANAARTQTAAAMPTSTATQLPTQTPVDTFTPSPTFTSTVIFILASPTVPPTITPTFFISGGGGGSSSRDYACEVLSVSPANGTIFDARTDFDAVWQVKNIGTENWDHNSIDYSYDNGTQMHRVDAYDLGSDVRVGRTIDIIVDMRAPRNAGSYRTTWQLGNSGNKFCRMSLTINVR